VVRRPGVAVSVLHAQRRMPRDHRCRVFVANDWTAVVPPAVVATASRSGSCCYESRVVRALLLLCLFSPTFVAHMAPALLRPERASYYGGRPFVEGLCWVQDKLAHSLGLRRIWREASPRWDAYSEGYQLMCWLENEGGSFAVVDLARSAQARVAGEQLDEAALLERSGLLNDVRTKDARFGDQPPPEDVLRPEAEGAPH